MIALITGDIVKSREVNPSKWLKPLKEELSNYGETPKSWEISRGDSFQLEIKDVSSVFVAIVKLKAAIKSIETIDVRLSIGIGAKNYSAKRISESNGEAFVNSGEQFENLKKKKQNILIKSPWPKFDAEMNLYFALALIAMDNWSAKSAEIIKIALQNPELKQEELGKLLRIKQNAVSTRLQRAYFNEIMALNDMFQVKLAENI